MGPKHDIFRLCFLFISLKVQYIIQASLNITFWHLQGKWTVKNLFYNILWIPSFEKRVALMLFSRKENFWNVLHFCKSWWTVSFPSAFCRTTFNYRHIWFLLSSEQKERQKLCFHGKSQGWTATSALLKYEQLLCSGVPNYFITT